ncbi:MAG: hypothetical protein FWE95_08165 [Planctomycetaceae bacterium]|nr:hypothetical protein [Planctomycetaceae bacterium]
MKTLIFKTFCVIALCGIVNAENYILDGTLEPDPMPLSRSEVTAPARILPSEKPEYDLDSLVLPGDIPVKPPQLIRNDAGQLVLVQYISRGQSAARNQQQGNPNATRTPQNSQANAARPQNTQANTRPQGQGGQQAAQSTIPDLPLNNFDSMNEVERIAALKRSIEIVLVANTRRGVNTRDNTPNEVMLMALPYGADAKVFQPNPNYNPRDRNAANVPTGNSIYSIGALCWNTPLNGKTLLRSDGKKVIARVGFGYQNQPGSFAAMMAMSSIMPNYELKVGGNSYTIADLLESEKHSVSKGMNMSMVLVALSCYGNPTEQWKNEFGETWNIEKMLTSELNRSIDQGTSDVTDWLLGITSAVKLYESENIPIRGTMALAKRQLKTYQDFVLEIQNDRYLWHPRFFLYKGYNPNAPFETMNSGGHILRWLVFSLSDKELQDPQVVRSVMNLASTVNRVKPETMASTMSAKQLESLAVALHALSLYYQRTFGEEPPTQSRGVAAL